MMQHQTPMGVRQIELKSRFCSGEECFTDPHSVQIRLPADFPDRAKQAVDVMHERDFNQVTLSPVGEYILLDKNGNAIENDLLNVCQAEIYRSGTVRFVFPFRHARDEGYTAQNWTLEELIACAQDSFATRPAPLTRDKVTRRKDH